jgi:hypothetical protein
MLQATQIKKGARQASSLYCRWICVQSPKGKQLTAIWFDSEMRAFEKGPQSEATSELHAGSFAEEPERCTRSQLIGS